MARLLPYVISVLINGNCCSLDMYASWQVSRCLRVTPYCCDPFKILSMPNSTPPRRICLLSRITSAGSVRRPFWRTPHSTNHVEMATASEGSSQLMLELIYTAPGWSSVLFHVQGGNFPRRFREEHFMPSAPVVTLVFR